MAAADWFARYLTLERLERWKGMLNSDVLQLFGPQATKLEFDYDSPIPDDPERTNADRESKANAAAIYIGAGATPESVQKALDLPEALEWAEPEPPPAQIPAQAAPGVPVAPGEAIPAEAVADLLRTVMEGRARDDDRPSRSFRQYWD